MTTSASVLYDSISAQAMPANAQMEAGYVDGNWPDYNQLRAPIRVSITTRSTPNVRVCDVETGDDTPAQGAAWAKGEHAAGRRPTIYCNRSTVAAAVTALRAVGLDQGAPLQGGHRGDVDWWVADWTGSAHLLPGTVATQYAHDVNGCDLSVTDGVWPMQTNFQINPPVSFNAPVTAFLAWPHGGFLLLSELGGVYAFGGAPYLGCANLKPYFAGRTAASLTYMATGSAAGYGEGYTITDTAGETYHYDGRPNE